MLQPLAAACLRLNAEMHMSFGLSYTRPETARTGQCQSPRPNLGQSTGTPIRIGRVWEFTGSDLMCRSISTRPRDQSKCVVPYIVQPAQAITDHKIGQS